MGPQVETVEQTTPSTGLANDIIRQIQGELDEGAFGLGSGPLQRNAGDSIQRFIESLSSVLSGGTSPGTEQLVGSVREGAARRTERDVADLREGFSIGGNRFGTALADSEALLRAEAGVGTDQVVGGILTQQRNTDLALLLQAIAQMQQQGVQNIQPGLQLAQTGILPDEIIVSPGLADQLLAGGLQAGAAFAGRPG